jgi:uncharacterized protein (TIGR02646 family)
MRHIHKPDHARGPYCLQQKFDQGTPVEPTKAWQKLGSDCKQSLIEEYLKPEQYQLCAYSEIDLKTFGCHIEHIKPKNKNRYPESTFDYHNLIASAFDSEALQKHSYADRFGGHFKCGDKSQHEQDKYDPNLFICPLEADCSRFFSYEPNGDVKPHPSLNQSETERAQYTIDALNLNAPYLVEERRRIIEEMLPIIDELLDDEEALRHFAEIDLCVTNGKLQPFHSTRLQQFGTLGLQVMQDKNCF